MNPDLRKIAALLRPLCEAAVSVREVASRAIIEGADHPNVGRSLFALLDYCEAQDLQRAITVEVEDVETDSQELREQMEARIPVRAWRVQVHKEGMAPTGGDVRTLWFLTATGFNGWANAIDPFGVEPEWMDPDVVVRILVDGLRHPFGGPRLAVADMTAAGIPDNWPRAWQGPGDQDVKKQVHLLTDQATILDPGRFLLDWGDVDSTDAAAFRMLCGRTLATCLAQVSYRSNKVVLKGAKILELPLHDETADPPSAADLGRLKSAVEWVYEERPEIRAELVADRLSLDLRAEEPLLSGASRLIDDALAQAKERYRFVIADQKEAWTKELREVLKDVQGQTRLYSDKLRSIMNSLLRDVLAALLLVSLGLFARFGKSQDVLGSHEAELLFRALGIYLLASFALQAFVHLRDVIISDREVRAWAMQTRSHLGPDALKKYLDDRLDKRWREFVVTGLVLALAYLLLAVGAWCFQPLMRAFGLLSP